MAWIFTLTPTLSHQGRGGKIARCTRNDKVGRVVSYSQVAKPIAQPVPAGER